MMLFTYAFRGHIDYDSAYCPPDESTLVPRAAPGECWSYRTSWIYELGIRMHLATVIPAGFLACFQFIPLIRRKALAVHQLNGYLVLVLSLVGTAGGIMIAPMTFGGPLETQAIVWVLGIAFVSSLILAMVNIRQLQLEEHRAWMLRAWFYVRPFLSLTTVFVFVSKDKQTDSKLSLLTCALLTCVGRMYHHCKTVYYPRRHLRQQTQCRAILPQHIVYQDWAILRQLYQLSREISRLSRSVGLGVCPGQLRRQS